MTYLRISAYSYPALAVYNAGAALYRSIGKTSVTMYIAVVSNVINVVGNLIGVFVLHAGVAGVAYPSVKGLRAAGDVKFTVVWSIVTTIGVRLLASVLLAIVFDMGVIGIALAMSFDWCVRAVAFYIRFRGGKWKKYQLI